MKAISLWQPWASMIAEGKKPYETRHWAPPPIVIGHRVAIHAARKWDRELREWAADFGYDPDAMPLGVVVCTARLVAAHQCAATAENELPAHLVACARSLGNDRMLKRIGGRLCITADRFGDYSPGRWAWRLDDVEQIDPPLPATGRQGFWNWEAPR